MNRRRFLDLLTTATVGATVAYSFPSIIVPQNLLAIPRPIFDPYTRLAKPCGDYSIHADDDIVSVKGGMTVTLPAPHGLPILVIPNNGVVRIIGSGCALTVSKPTYMVSNGNKWFAVNT